MQLAELINKLSFEFVGLQFEIVTEEELYFSHEGINYFVYSDGSGLKKI